MKSHTSFRRALALSVGLALTALTATPAVAFIAIPPPPPEPSPSICSTQYACYDVTYNLVPSSSCTRFVVGMANFSPENISVNGVDVQTHGQRLDMTKLTTQCSTGPSTVVFTRR